MKSFGYARVSSKEQNLDRQLVELMKYVDEQFIFSDKHSGKDFNRPNYQLIKKATRKGDTIYIKSLDRLGRNKAQIKQELEYFKNQGIRVKILDLPTTMINLIEGQEWMLEMINNLLIEVLSTIAEQERITTKTRQEEGIAVARLKGKHLGRPKTTLPSNFGDVYSNWKHGSITALEAMNTLKLKRTTFYKLVKVYECK